MFKIEYRVFANGRMLVGFDGSLVEMSMVEDVIMSFANKNTNAEFKVAEIIDSECEVGIVVHNRDVYFKILEGGLCLETCNTLNEAITIAKTWEEKYKDNVVYTFKASVV